MIDASYLVAKQVAGYILIGLGFSTLLALILVAIATTLIHFSWWQRSERAHIRRANETLKGSGKPSFWISDAGYKWTHRLVRTFAINLDDDTGNTDASAVRAVKGVPNLHHSPGLISNDGQSTQTLPLRFQPEKLYGATSSIYRDNLRKKSWCSLSTAPVEKTGRKLSVIDSLLHLGGTKSPSVLWDVERCKALLEKQSNPAPFLNTSAMNIPKIQLTCEQDDVDSHSEESYETEDDDDSQEETGNGRSGLGIGLAQRRASSSKMELTSSWMDSLTSQLQDVTKHGNKDDRLSLAASPLNYVKRNSLVFDSMMFKSNALTPNESRRGSHADTSRVTETEPATKVSVRKSFDATIKMQGSMLDSFGGRLAFGINYSPLKLEIYFTGIDSIASPRPWQLSSLQLKCTFISHTGNCHSNILKAKNIEFGSFTFSKMSKSLVTFHFDSDSKLLDKTTAGLGDLHISIFEQCPNWTSGKEFYHGSVDLAIDSDLLNTGENKGDAIVLLPTWYTMDIVYPFVCLSGDILVSVAQRRMEGVVSVGVHELRNMRLLVRDPKVSLKDMIDVDEFSISVHVCLTQLGHLVKTKKLTSLEQTVPILKSSTQKGTGLERIKSNQLNFSNKAWQQVVQFQFPGTKKSVNKQLLAEYGLIIYVSTNIPLANHLPLTTSIANQLKSIGLSNWKTLNATGRCEINYQASHGKRAPEVGGYCSVSSLDQSNALWNESMRYDGSRVYQWLSLE